MIQRIFALFIVLAGLLAACAPAPAVENTFSAEVSVAEAARLREQGAFILDVRTPQEWNEGHIPGATLIPLDQLADRVKEVPADKPVVVVCRTGNRSATGRDLLKKAGWVNVTSMAGGVTEWAKQGLPTEKGN